MTEEMKNLCAVKFEAEATRINKIENEYARLKERVNSIDTRTAINERDIQEIKADLTVIKNNTSKLLWIVIIAIISAVMKFVLAGGLNL